MSASWPPWLARPAWQLGRSGGWLAGGGAQRLHPAGRIVRAEHGRARDEHVGAGLGAAADRLLGHAAVDLQPDRPAARAQQIARPADLGQDDIEERLAA